MVHDGVNPESGVWLSVSLLRQGPVLISKQHPNRGTHKALPTPHCTRQLTITPTATNPCIISDYSKERQHWINSSSMEWDVSTKLLLNPSANHVGHRSQWISLFFGNLGIPKIYVLWKYSMALGQVHQCVAWDIKRRLWESGAEGGLKHGHLCTFNRQRIQSNSSEVDLRKTNVTLILCYSSTEYCMNQISWMV